MTPSRLIFIFLFFLFCFVISTEAQATYLYHSCPNTTTFTRNSTCHSNLNLLLSSLSSNSSKNLGLHNASAGREPYDVYGLYLCRGDSSADVCRNCVTVAVKDIVRLCPVEEVAIVWYDECLLRYSNQFIFSTMAQAPTVSLLNTQNVSDQQRFNEVVMKTMEVTAKALSDNYKKFAVDKVNVSEFQNLYTLAQCTPDLSNSDCKRCLEIAISQLPSCCGGKRGGRVLSPSCNVRYEFYPFYNESVLEVQSPQPSPAVLPPPMAQGRKQEGKRRISTVLIVAIVAPIAVSILLFCLGCCFLRRRARKMYDSTKQENESGNDISTVESLQIDLNTLHVATNNFSDANKLGEGGFDPEKQGQLDWSRRYKIILGIARGILYLHEDSRLRIVHRDLKASNILLDREMNPKISDFSMARIFGADQTQGNTSRVVGTYGYMALEYAMRGHFSTKSDMYSFGVLVLEIVSGKKNSSFYQTDGEYDLISYVWKHWRSGTPMEVLDPALGDSYVRNEALRCIQMGLLCLQEDPAERPTMATVVLMLSSYSVTLSLPSQPALFYHSRSEQGMPTKGLESDQSTSKSIPCSVDEGSITDVYPR